MSSNQNENNNPSKATSAALEAILFLHGEAVGSKKLCQLLDITPEELLALTKELKEHLARDERGIMLIEKDASYLLATKPQFAHFLEQFIKEDLKEDLSPATVEALSLIAYFGPLSRVQIDYLRGVNSSFIIRNLLIRGLIERVGSKGNAYVYNVTFDFIKYMGVSSVQELPEYEHYQTMKETYFQQPETTETPITPTL